MAATDEFVTRMATVEDAALIGEHRHRMFVDSGQAEDARMETVIANFVPWVRERLLSGTYVGWLTEKDGKVVAGAGTLLMDFPPHWMDPAPLRAYLLNFYVTPEMRGHGLAGALLNSGGLPARFEVWAARL